MWLELNESDGRRTVDVEYKLPSALSGALHVAGLMFGLLALCGSVILYAAAQI